MERSFKQTLQDVTVSVPMAPTRAKFLRVDFAPRSVRVVNTLTNEELLAGELFAPILVDDSTWWVEENVTLYLTLEKQNQQQWWPHVLVTDPKIDVSKIEPEKSRLDDLDPETRGTVEKMLFDQQQKQKGLPTSDELQKQKTLERFKQMHPELDFSKAKTQF